mgnify:CR=1 FL=1
MEENNLMSEMGFELKDTPQTEDTQTSDETTYGACENNSAENTLKTIAIITLVCGIVLTLILLFTICWIDNPAYHYHHEKIFNPSGFGITCGVLISSLISWAALNVFANISLTLKKINSKLKD